MIFSTILEFHSQSSCQIFDAYTLFSFPFLPKTFFLSERKMCSLCTQPIFSYPTPSVTDIIYLFHFILVPELKLSHSDVSPALLSCCGLSFLSGLQQGTYIQLGKTFHLSICTSYWPIYLLSLNSKQVTFAFIFSSFLFSSLITQISIFSAENDFSEASFSPSQMSPDSSFFLLLHVFFLWLLVPVKLQAYLLVLGCIFV